MNKVLVFYWLAVAIVFFIQAQFQKGAFNIALAYSITAIPVALLSHLAFSSIGESFNWKQFAISMLTALAATFALYNLEASFTWTALPLSIAIGYPYFKFAYLSLYKSTNATKLQKLLGTLLFFKAVHAINFALFRMEPGAQLWGWVIAYALYDITGILMPIVAIEKKSIEDKEELERMAEEKTSSILEINHSLHQQIKEKNNTLDLLYSKLESTSEELKIIKEVYSNPKASNDKMGPSLLLRFENSIKGIEESIQKVTHIKD
ncbi:MAG: hypothetical protein CME64_12895 [Halobacteriovoraceae bacterium]|nr:hypothetical protein [Halobacteriovoraceae bacterium]|tara:strand:+ start:115290 stop:116078 length:789 start_codon:yes stop_codon:yes gene_type:complete